MIVAPPCGASHLRSEFRRSGSVRRFAPPVGVRRVKLLAVTLMRRLGLALLWVSLPLSARAQQRTGDTIVVRAQLPRDVAVEVVSLFNATTTLRSTERTDIAAGRDVPGDVAVLDGPLTIAGHVAGRVL